MKPPVVVEGVALGELPITKLATKTNSSHIFEAVKTTQVFTCIS